MTARLLTNTKRPLSAIFIGGTTPPASDPPTPSHRYEQQQQLPSPPSSSKDSNSNGSGGRGDEERIVMTRSGTGPRASSSSDDDLQDDNEDHTAKLTLSHGSNASDRRDALDRESVVSSRAGFRDGVALERSASLAARNRQVRLLGSFQVCGYGLDVDVHVFLGSRNNDINHQSARQPPSAFHLQVSSSSSSIYP